MSNVFPKWTNRLPLIALVGGLVTGACVVAGVTYYFTPKYSRVGYQPVQPVSFSHEIHAGQLGMDCRSCHNDVEKSWFSNIPTAETCMRCHSSVLKDDPRLKPIRESFENKKPVKWVQVHKTPDYVYFNHAVHVNRGVSCVECHGRVDQMDEVKHAKPLSMAFCLDCHRNPHEHVRPQGEVFNLGWEPGEDWEAEREGTALVNKMKLRTAESCSACHR
jgi:formate-dependent nitrite reductase cytochrome c552 subunit